MRNIKEKQTVFSNVTTLSHDFMLEPEFFSITKKFLSSPKSREISCPFCRSCLNFRSGLEWIGPDSFTCNKCKQLLHISLIHQALRDLGEK